MEAEKSGRLEKLVELSPWRVQLTKMHAESIRVSAPPTGMDRHENHALIGAKQAVTVA